MPCDHFDHQHFWPTSGTLVIERCEKYCQFCTGAKAHHPFKFAWFLRRHVATVHAGKQFPDLIVAEDWSRKTPKKPASVTTIANRQAAAYRRRLSKAMANFPPLQPIAAAMPAHEVEMQQVINFNEPIQGNNIINFNEPINVNDMISFNEPIQANNMINFNEHINGNNVNSFNEPIQANNMMSFNESIQGNNIANFNEAIQANDISQAQALANNNSNALGGDWAQFNAAIDNVVDEIMVNDINTIGQLPDGFLEGYEFDGDLLVNDPFPPTWQQAITAANIVEPAEITVPVMDMNAEQLQPMMAFSTEGMQHQQAFAPASGQLYNGAMTINPQNLML